MIHVRLNCCFSLISAAKIYCEIIAKFVTLCILRAGHHLLGAEDGSLTVVREDSDAGL